MRRFAMMSMAVLLGACGGDAAEDFPVTDPPEPSQELTIAADTAEEEFLQDEAVGVIAVQGGEIVEGPFTATGNLRGDGSTTPPGAVTITSENGSTRVLISLEGQQPNGELQATFVRGRCGQSGEVVQVLEPAITIPASGIATYETTAPVPTQTLFDGAHSIKVVPAPAASGPQDAGAVIACADLGEVETR